MQEDRRLMTQEALSGGPVINEEVYVVGIATGVPDGEGLDSSIPFKES